MTPPGARGAGAPPERSATGGGTPTERGTIAPAIPDKIYFKIGEVARLTGVKPYVLRYWETEFHAIQPVKSQSRQRLYRKRDVELLLKIKDLLYKQRFTIEGARKRIRELFGEPEPAPVAAPAAQGREAEARALAQEILVLASKPL